jgi:hypothetical protein
MGLTRKWGRRGLSPSSDHTSARRLGQVTSPQVHERWCHAPLDTANFTALVQLSQVQCLAIRTHPAYTQKHQLAQNMECKCQTHRPLCGQMQPHQIQDIATQRKGTDVHKAGQYWQRRYRICFLSSSSTAEKLSREPARSNELYLTTPMKGVPEQRIERLKERDAPQHITDIQQLLGFQTLSKIE